VNPGRGEQAPRADTENAAHETLVERLRTLRWPTAEPGQAERAFERFKSAIERSDDEA
jgi:hypothetical protein